MALIISAPLLDQLRQHGEQTYPHECCGVLVGEFDEAGSKTVKTVVACGNTRTDSPHNRYHISPIELVRIQREARVAGLDIVGFYHSHPDHPAHWSSTDLAEAHWTGCSYVITSVEKGKAALTNSFLLVEEAESKRFVNETIEQLLDVGVYAGDKAK
jgi:proteasome lid subunit RPN8/RPN11